MKEEIDSKCWLCEQHEETVDHLTSGCLILAKNEYVMRHDKVFAHQIDRHLVHMHTHTSKPVCEHEDVTVL